MIERLIFLYGRAQTMLSAAWTFIVNVSRRGLPKIFVEFLTEAAVLLAVFPLLDTIIEKGQAKVTLSLVIWSIVLSLGCLFLAGVISMVSKEE